MSPGHTPGGNEEPAVADTAVREEGEGGQQPAPGPWSHVGCVGDVDANTPKQLLSGNGTIFY